MLFTQIQIYQDSQKTFAEVVYLCCNSIFLDSIFVNIKLHYLYIHIYILIAINNALTNILEASWNFALKELDNDKFSMQQ